jgi:hypothetical protein
MYKYLEIVRIEHQINDVVVKRMDMTGKSDRQIERIENGIWINLNHQDFYTRVTESDTELPTI